MNPIFTQFMAGLSGKASSMRLVMLVWSIGVFVVWAFISVKSNQMVVIPDNILYALSVVIGGKVFQRFKEGQTKNETTQ
jgi:hypothetical protein